MARVARARPPSWPGLFSHAPQTRLQGEKSRQSTDEERLKGAIAAFMPSVPQRLDKYLP